MIEKKEQKSLTAMMKKVMCWKPPMKLVAVLSFAAFVAMMIPLLLVTRYAIPWSDDYSYGRFGRAGLVVSGNIFGAMASSLECVIHQWHEWQGTYSSIFCMCMMPGILGDEYYFLGPVLVLLLLVLAIFVLIKVLLRDVLKCDYASCLIVQSVVSIMVFLLMYSAKEGIYWYNSGIHYVGMHAMGILLVACLIKLLVCNSGAEKGVLMVLSVLMAFVVAGSNYITALQTFLVLLSILVVSVYLRKKFGMILPAIVVYAGGFAINVLAPGNGVRARNFQAGKPAVEAVLHSFVEALRYFSQFTGWMTVAIMILLLPVIWHIVKKTDFSFRYPGIVLIWSVCLYATGFTSSLYSMGHGGVDRMLNAAKITFQLLLILNELYWLGWLKQHWQDKGKMKLSGECVWWFYPLVGMVMLLIFAGCPNPLVKYSSFSAYYYLRSGEAKAFYGEYRERVAVLEGEEDNIVLQPYQHQPWLLYMGDLTDDPWKECNYALRTWYGKESVVVETSEE